MNQNVYKLNVNANSSDPVKILKIDLPCSKTGKNFTFSFEQPHRFLSSNFAEIGNEPNTIKLDTSKLGLGKDSYKST